MAGGELVVTPAESIGFCPEDATIVGNTCLYGATGGQVFVRGKAGERFAVRNSLAQAVVEGTGDHCCEYMTGGCVVVLGKWVAFLLMSSLFWKRKEKEHNNLLWVVSNKSVKLLLNRVGRNVAAGMTGGLAYILDEDDTLIPKVCDDELYKQEMCKIVLCMHTQLLCWKITSILKVMLDRT